TPGPRPGRVAMGVPQARLGPARRPRTRRNEARAGTIGAFGATTSARKGHDIGRTMTSARTMAGLRGILRAEDCKRPTRRDRAMPRLPGRREDWTACVRPGRRPTRGQRTFPHRAEAVGRGPPPPRPSWGDGAGTMTADPDGP